MTEPTYVLVPGAGGKPSFWDRVVPLLRAAGRSAVAVGLPNWPGATLTDQGDAIVMAGQGLTEVVLVAHSMGGFSAPLACDRLPVVRLVLVNAMIPTSGETAGTWWENVGQPGAVRENETRSGRDPDAPFDPDTVFLHDLPPDLAELLRDGDEGPADSLFEQVYPLDAWPDVSTEVLSGVDDRLFPYELQRRVARVRLGLATEPVPGGHLLALSQPESLTERLLRTSWGAGVAQA